jgi:hypothetical protein
MIPSWLNTINAGAWIASNVLILYIAILLVIFVVFYFVVFDPRATTAGKNIFRFITSLVGVIGLVFIGSFVDPSSGRAWNQYPGDIIFWRPILRLAVYGYVAYAVTALVALLVIRKWWPQKLRTSLDLQLIKPRHADVPDALNENSSHSGKTL